MSRLVTAVVAQSHLVPEPLQADATALRNAALQLESLDETATATLAEALMALTAAVAGATTEDSQIAEFTSRLTALPSRIAPVAAAPWQIAWEEVAGSGLRAVCRGELVSVIAVSRGAVLASLPSWTAEVTALHSLRASSIVTLIGAVVPDLLNGAPEDFALVTEGYKCSLRDAIAAEAFGPVFPKAAEGKVKVLRGLAEGLLVAIDRKVGIKCVSADAAVLTADFNAKWGPLAFISVGASSGIVAPERLRDPTVPLTAAQIVFAFGLLAFELFSGGVRAVVEDPMDPNISQRFRLAPDCGAPENVARLIVACCQQDPSRRPTLSTVIEALDGVAKPAAIDDSAAGLVDMPQLLTAVAAAKVGEVRDLLLRGANVEMRDANGMTPLQIASQRGSVDVCRLLLDRGAAIDAQDSKYKYTALHCAASHARTAVVELLLERGANIDARNYETKTPLAIATQRNHVATADFLRSRGAQVQ